MHAEALAVAASLFALAVCVAYILRDRAALRVEDELCEALRRLAQANAALGMAEDEIARLNAALKAARKDGAR